MSTPPPSDSTPAVPPGPPAGPPSGPPGGPPPVPPRFGPPPRPEISLAARARRSMVFKLFAIGAIVVLLLIPLLMLDSLIGERERLRDQARTEVAAQWGQEQSIGGPVLTVPYTFIERSGSGAEATTQTSTRYVHLFPDELTVTGRLEPQVRTKGIYKVVLYHSDLAMSGRFPPLDAAALGVPAGALRPDEAFVQIGIPDMTGIRQAIRLDWGGVVREADPGIVTSDVFSSGVSVPVTLPGEGGTPFRVRLSLNGSGSLGLLPVAKTTRMTISSPWDTPSFVGAFLPERRTVADSGFVAEWRVLHLNRNFPQAFAGSFNRPTALDRDVSGFDNSYSGVMAESAYDGGLATDGTNATFGVRLLLPVDEYQKANRAAEYGLLLVLLTFMTFFFVEVFSDKRFHPVQYLLVGLAVTLFYLLLLAFAEYVPFDAAYGIAAAAILSLVTLYARAVFANWRLAGVVGGLLALFYGYFYVLLQLEAYALLVGSLGLLFTLAVVMYLSRRIDWYSDDPLAATPALSRPVPPPASEPAA